MATSTSLPPAAPARADHRRPHMLPVFTRATRPIRAAAKTAVFFLKVLPMLPSKPVNWVTSPPVIERVSSCVAWVWNVVCKTVLGHFRAACFNALPGLVLFFIVRCCFYSTSLRLAWIKRDTR